MEEKLKEYGLKVRWNDDPEREPIDFSVEDAEDNIAWVWGSEPWHDVQIECNHPHECVDFGDGEEQGECRICGALCDYHYEEDEDGNKVPEPHDWYHPKKIGGIVGDYLKELQAKW